MALSSDGPRVSLLQQVVTPLRLGLLPASLRDCVLCELLGGFQARDDDQHQEEEKEEERFVSRRAVAERYGVWRTPPSEKQDPVEDIAFE